MSSDEQKIMEADVQRTLLGNVSGSEQEDALAQNTENHQQQQTEIKDVIKAVHRHHNEGAGNSKLECRVKKKSKLV